MSFYKITPLHPHNGQLSKKATFFFPQGDRGGEVQQSQYREMIYCTNLNLPIKPKTV